MIFHRDKKEIAEETETGEMPPPHEQSPEYVAELKAAEKNEPIASFLRMKLVELSPGYARVTLKLSRRFTNFHGLIFGGIIASVADQAFAYACNSVARPSVAGQFNIHFIGVADVDDELTAECWVVRSGKRMGVSEITVSNQDGKLIAKATATSIPVGQS